MSFDRFATVMIAIGAGIGLAATSAVPTIAQSPERLQPVASAADYPEITATTYESYPVATVPVFNRAPLQLAAWEQPWRDPPIGESAEPLPDYVEAEEHFAPDPQIDEQVSYETANAIEADEVLERPVELTLAAHP